MPQLTKRQGVRPKCLYPTASVILTVSFPNIITAGDPSLNVPEEQANSIILLRSDADKNNTISIVDSLVLKQYLVGQLTLGDINPLNAACVNHDGASGDEISVVDALAIEHCHPICLSLLLPFTIT